MGLGFRLQVQGLGSLGFGVYLDPKKTTLLLGIRDSYSGLGIHIIVTWHKSLER